MTTEDSTDIAVREAGAMIYPAPDASPQQQVMQVIAQATLSGQSDIETMRGLMEMQKEMIADERRAAFFDAMAAFQSECPPIVKDKKGYVGSYAPLDSIIRQTRGLIAAHGFNYSFDTELMDDGRLRVICIVRHREGHEERTQSVVPKPQMSKAANDAQQAGAQETYGRRFAFTGAFGIMTSDEDTDARADVSFQPISGNQVDELKGLAKEAGFTTMGKLKPVLQSVLGVDSLQDIAKQDYTVIRQALLDRAAAQRGPVVTDDDIPE